MKQQSKYNNPAGYNRYDPEQTSKQFLERIKLAEQRERKILAERYSKNKVNVI